VSFSLQLELRCEAMSSDWLRVVQKGIAKIPGRCRITHPPARIGVRVQ
jgi:hypothetical protein